MAKKQHLSRLAAPNTWPIARKSSKWIAKQSPGAHTLRYSMPLVVIVRDLLKLTDTKKQVKQLLHSRDISVNAKPVKDTDYAVGLFDILSLPKIKKHYRIVLDATGKLIPLEVSEKEADLLLLKVRRKTAVRGGQIQINLHNGWNMLVKKASYCVGDVLLFNLSTRKVVKHLKTDSGNVVYLIGGKYAGKVAQLKSVRETGNLRKTRIATLVAGKETLETPVQNLVTVGIKTPEVKLS